MPTDEDEFSDLSGGKFRLGFQTPESGSIESQLSDLDTDEADDFRGAFAYVTVKGVDQLYNGLPEALGVTEPKWLVSFDYGYTEPEAIRRLAEGGEVRVVGAQQLIERETLHPNTRFHPKIIWIQEGEHQHLMVGSANLTESALTRNWESVVLLRSVEIDNSAVSSLSSWWEEVWAESIEIGEELLEWYGDIREDSDIGPSRGAEDHDEWGEGHDIQDASILWAHVGYTQGGSKNQMDIPVPFGRYFIEHDDKWEVDDSYDVRFRYEDQGVLDGMVVYHSNKQTRIHLPTETRGVRLEELFSENKYDEESLRYYFAIFRRINPYHFKLRILPPEDVSEIRELMEVSLQRGQVDRTDEDPERLVGWM